MRYKKTCGNVRCNKKGMSKPIPVWEGWGPYWHYSSYCKYCNHKRRVSRSWKSKPKRIEPVEPELVILSEISRRLNEAGVETSVSRWRFESNSPHMLDLRGKEVNSDIHVENDIIVARIYIDSHGIAFANRTFRLADPDCFDKVALFAITNWKKAKNDCN